MAVAQSLDDRAVGDDAEDGSLSHLVGHRADPVGVEQQACPLQIGQRVDEAQERLYNLRFAAAPVHRFRERKPTRLEVGTQAVDGGITDEVCDARHRKVILSVRFLSEASRIALFPCAFIDIAWLNIGPIQTAR
jgi:hypothetical protein